jgi:hypothetical protein
MGELGAGGVIKTRCELATGARNETLHDRAKDKLSGRSHSYQGGSMYEFL